MPHKLLLADDSVTIQRVIELTFADEDVLVTAVGDGRQAIEQIQADPPDIVLADVGMPEKDGYEVAAFIKNDPRYAHIPVLLLTGAFEPVDEERARAVGCDGVLAKPFEPQMVITRVKELLAEAARPVPASRVIPMPPQAGAAGPALVPPAAVPAEAAPDAPVETVQMSTAEVLAELDALTLPMTAAAPAAEPGSDNAREEEPVELESALDAAVRIRRRPTIPVPEFGVPPAPVQAAVPEAASAPAPAPPEPAAGQRAALDDYFERLDAAFTNLTQAGPSAPPAPGTSRTPPLASEEESAPGAPPDSGFDARPPAVADAFSALLAAERGEGDGTPFASLFGSPAPAIDVDELADRVTRQVLEHLTDRVVRETVTDIVSRVAERMIREEIDRLKATIR